jgi:hypothetical protein
VNSLIIQPGKEDRFRRITILVSASKREKILSGKRFLLHVQTIFPVDFVKSVNDGTQRKSDSIKTSIAITRINELAIVITGSIITGESAKKLDSISLAAGDEILTACKVEGKLISRKNVDERVIVRTINRAIWYLRTLCFGNNNKRNHLSFLF